MIFAPFLSNPDLSGFERLTSVSSGEGMKGIRESTEADLQSIFHVVRSAFPDEQGDEISDLTRELLRDPSAKPYLSLVAEQNEQLVGYVLFTRVEIVGQEIPATILAPLAVSPEYQRQGIGGELIQEGLKLLANLGTDLVFVLGHEDYYPHHRFIPAGVCGFEAPYPIPAEHAGAWMVQELSPGTIAQSKGQVKCADALDHPEHWVE